MKLDWWLLYVELCLCSPGRHSESVRGLVLGAAHTPLCPFNTNLSPPSDYDILLPPQGSPPRPKPPPLPPASLTSPPRPSMSVCLGLCLSVLPLCEPVLSVVSVSPCRHDNTPCLSVLFYPPTLKNSLILNQAD